MHRWIKITSKFKYKDKGRYPNQGSDLFFSCVGAGGELPTSTLLAVAYSSPSPPSGAVVPLSPPLTINYQLSYPHAWCYSEGSAERRQDCEYNLKNLFPSFFLHNFLVFLVINNVLDYRCKGTTFFLHHQKSPCRVMWNSINISAIDFEGKKHGN